MSTILKVWNVLDWLIDPSHHWATAILLGLLVFGLAWLGSLPAYGVMRLVARRTLAGDVKWYLVARAGVTGLAAWLLSFPLLDYGWVLWTQPLDPPLELVVTPRMLGLPDGYVIFWAAAAALAGIWALAMVWLLARIYQEIKRER